MKGYLLDTSTCVAIFRGNRQVAAKLNEAGKEKCFISPIVVAELLFGAYRSKLVEENLKQTREPRGLVPVSYAIIDQEMFDAEIQNLRK